jgi:hypothetical protein
MTFFWPSLPICSFRIYIRKRNRHKQVGTKGGEHEWMMKVKDKGGITAGINILQYKEQNGYGDEFVSRDWRIRGV